MFRNVVINQNYSDNFYIDCIELLHRIFVSVPSGYFDFMVNNVGLYCIMSRTLIQFPRMQRKGRPWP